MAESNKLCIPSSIFPKKNSKKRETTRKQYKCKKFNTIFKSLNYLNRHNRYKHTTMKYVCPHCSKEYVRKPFFLRHVKLHCKKCFVLQCNNGSLDQHMLKCRKLVSDNQIVETTNYTCDICTDQFPTHCLLACHKACAHSERPATYEALYHQLIIGASAVYVCFFCKLSSADKNYLESHVTGIRHMMETYVKYTCNYCSENFNTEIDLMDHKWLHDQNEEIPVENANITNCIPETVENMGKVYIEVNIEETPRNIEQQVNTATTSSVENNKAEAQSLHNRILNRNIDLDEQTRAIAISTNEAMRNLCQTALRRHQEMELYQPNDEEEEFIEISSDEDDKKCIIEHPTTTLPIESQRPENAVSEFSSKTTRCHISGSH